MSALPASVAFHRLGREHHAAGRTAAAAAAFRRAVALEPREPASLFNLALVGSPAEAAVAYRRAVRLCPALAPAWVNLGTLRLDADPAQAEALLRRGAALDPACAAAYDGLGLALMRRKRPEDAVGPLRRAAVLAPDAATHHHNLAIALQESGALGGAAAAYGRAVARDPGLRSAWSNRLLVLHYLPWVTVTRLAELHRRFGAVFDRPGRPPATAPDPERRLRVGYVSPDLKDHPVAVFLGPLLAAHDRSAVSVLCYADGPGDAVTGRLRPLADLWRDTTALDDEALADWIRADAVDLLVDLAGHTAGNRLPVFARRPAPVQLTWLGYPDGTGLAAIGWRLTDAVADPPGPADGHTVETPVRLPGGFLCFRPPDHAPEPRLPDAGAPLTFGSFNNVLKLNDEVAAVWAAILHRMPASRLLLKCRRLAAEGERRRVAALFARCGVADRIDLRAHVEDPAEHLALYGSVDVALDPFPYNGTTTTCEALWMGVPVVTLAGDRHAGRVGASLLTRVGLPDLVAESAAAYVDRAAELAADRARRAALRRSLRKRMSASPLCDAPAFARQIETAYRAMWQSWCALRAHTNGHCQ